MAVLRAVKSSTRIVIIFVLSMYYKVIIEALNGSVWLCMALFFISPLLCETIGDSMRQ